MDQKASVSFYTLDVPLHCKAGCIHCVGSFPMALWLGRQMSNRMLLAECETGVSSGRNLRDIYQDFGKARHPCSTRWILLFGLHEM